MKKLVIFCLAGFCVFAGLAFRTNKEKTATANTIYGIWLESRNAVDTTATGRLGFYPGGKFTVLRKGHKTLGYFKIRRQDANTLAGSLTVGESFPFTATFMGPDRLRLTVSNKDQAAVYYLRKIAGIRSGFQLLGSE